MKVVKHLPLVLLGFIFAGCHLDMVTQPKVKSQREYKFYADLQGTREPVQGTVAFGEAKQDKAFYTGFENRKLIKEFPVPVTKELIERGQERYEIMCSHCHGAIGDGEGMIAQRGFAMERPVGNYHTERLREMPVGHFYDVITNGYGTMYPQGSRIKPLDRWAIVAYIRALQFSQFAGAGDLDAESRTKLSAPNTGENHGVLFPNKVSTQPVIENTEIEGNGEVATDPVTNETHEEEPVEAGH